MKRTENRNDLIDDLTRRIMYSLVELDLYDRDTCAAVDMAIDVHNWLAFYKDGMVQKNVINKLRQAVAGYDDDPDLIDMYDIVHNLIYEIRQYMGVDPDEFFVSEIIDRQTGEKTDILALYRSDLEGPIEMVDYVYGASDMTDAEIENEKHRMIHEYENR